MGQSNHLNDREHAELLMLHPSLAEDTRQLKRQQWTVTYYGLLLHSALIAYVAFRKQHGGPSFSESLLLAVLALLVVIFGLWYLWKSHTSLVEYRCYAYRIQTSLSQHFNRCIGGSTMPSCYKDIELAIGKGFFLVVGALVVIWTLFEHHWVLLTVAVALTFIDLEMLIWMEGQCADTA